MYLYFYITKYGHDPVGMWVFTIALAWAISPKESSKRMCRTSLDVRKKLASTPFMYKCMVDVDVDGAHHF